MDWWDGPLNGLAIYNGERCWFDINCPDTNDRHYHYVLFPLADADANEAESWYRTRGRYDGSRGIWVGRDESHDATWLGPDLSLTEPLGWFEDGKNESFYAIKVHTSKI
jgi:hypothetical protein